MKVFMITWTERERGWGQRPDGYTVHMTREDSEAFVAAFWAREKARNPSGAAPDEYTSPDGPATEVTLRANSALAKQLTTDKAKKGHGVWGEGNSPKMKTTHALG